LIQRGKNKNVGLINSKKILTSFFFLLMSIFSFSQNWQLVNPLYKYNYYTVNPAIVKAAVWIDSTKNNPLTTYYLNRIVRTCDTCISAKLVNNPSDTTYLLSDQPSFMLRKVTLKNNGTYNFTDKGNIVIHVSDTLNSNWLFDSISNINARLISKTVTPVFSLPDSVQLIKLSSGDTIILSKNYGILQYPIMYSGHQYYKLAGIEGINKGLQTLKFKDFFNYAPGDVFQYSVNDDNYVFFPPLYKQGVKKIQILNRIKNSDTISYRVKTTVLDSTWLLGNPPSYNHSISIDTLVYIDSVTHFTNLYPDQLVPLRITTMTGYISTPSINQLQTDIDPAGLAVKYYGITCPNTVSNGTNYGVASSVDTINTYLYLIRNSVLVVGMEVKEGLGITSDVYDNYDEVKTTCLTGYFKGTDTVGTITPDSQLSSIATRSSKKFEVSVFPNPAHENCTLIFSSIYRGEINMFNSSGELVFSDDLKGNMQYRIDTRNFPAGIYLIKCSTLNSFVIKKIIIQ